MFFAIVDLFGECGYMSTKVALVTGANGGLGAPVTNALLDAGFLVAGLAPKIQANSFDHPHFTAVPVKLSNFDEAKKACETVIAHLGNIDLLVHTVGGFAGGQTVSETDEATWQRMFDMNVNTTFHILRAVIPLMRAAKSGRIVAIGSRAAESPGAKVGAYSASKAAVVSLIRTVAIENKDLGITANVILPGTIDTLANRAAMPGADTSAWVKPESIAGLILWLAGDAGKDVTGAAIPVYGKGL